jgi:hypothetical protein
MLTIFAAEEPSQMVELPLGGVDNHIRIQFQPFYPQQPIVIRRLFFRGDAEQPMIGIQ